MTVPKDKCMDLFLDLIIGVVAYQVPSTRLDRVSHITADIADPSAEVWVIAIRREV
jgi:hypothetical protein